MANAEQTNASQGTTNDDSARQPTPLADDALDNASGGIIAILIGLATQPKQPLGDGSVRVLGGGTSPTRAL